MRNGSRAVLGVLILGLVSGTVARAGDGKNAPPETPPQLSSELIDRGLDGTLNEAELTAQARSQDGEFLRRVSFDLVGTIPGPQKVVDFLADKDPKKRARLVDELMASPAYAEHATDFWMETLTSTQNGQRARFNRQLQAWVRSQMRNNAPYDRFVSALIRAQGYVDDNGAVAFSLNFNRDALALAATSSRLFMGVQIECAQCHDHPFADWKQQQFLEMAAWFSRLEPRNRLKSQQEIAADLARLQGQQRKRYLMNPRRTATRYGLFERPSGELVVNERGEPLTGRNRRESRERNVIKPAFVFAVELDRAVPSNRREAFALYVTSPDNPYFTRMGVNRIWSRFFGRGLINPIDDLSEASVSTHPELLDELAAAFTASGYDRNKLVRAIVLSQAYQRSSRPAQDDGPAAESGGEEQLMLLYGRMPVRPIGAKPLARALSRALLPANSPQAAGLAGRLSRTLGNLLGGRSLDLDRYEETMQEALFLQNSAQLEVGGRGRTDLVSTLLRTQPNDRERITRLFLNVLTRPAAPRELARYERYLAGQEDKYAAYQDILWVLLNSSEFRYNH